MVSTFLSIHTIPFKWSISCCTQAHSNASSSLEESAVKNNWAGIVVNGCIRDVEALKNLPIGIFAKGVVAQKTNKKNHGFEDVLISFGSAVMTSGKWIYIDQNGWLVADNKLKP